MEEAGPEIHTPVLIDHPIDHSLIDVDVLKVVNRLVRFNHTAYLVGGCVRDLLLGVQPKDFDVATSARPREVRRLFRNSKIIGRRFRLVHIYFADRKVIEVATFRRSPQVEDVDPELGDGEFEGDALAPDTQPAALKNDYLITDDNVFGTAGEDAFRRDFTINALFYDVKRKQIVDYVGGLEDLHKRTIRSIKDPFVSLQEDPVRALRAVRFAARLGLEIEPRLQESIQMYGCELRRSAPSRVLEEIYKLIRPGCACSTMEMLLDYGVMEVLLPELAQWVAQDPGPNSEKFLSLMEGLDQEIQTSARGVPLSNATFLASLLFCPMQEMLNFDQAPNSEAGERTQSKSSYMEAMGAVSQMTGAVGQRMRVPRRDQERIRNIMVEQTRIESALGGGVRKSRVQRMVRRPCFKEALMLFQLNCPQEPDQGDPSTGNKNTVEWLWSLAGQVVEQGDSPQGDKPRTGSSRRRGRRRSRPRRRTKVKAQTQ